MPRDYILVGSCEPLFAGVCNTFGLWDDGREYMAAARWQSIPEECRINYKNNISSGETVQVGECYYRRNRVVLNDELFADMGESVLISEFPCITTAVITGWSQRLGDYLSSTPMLTSLELKSPQSHRIDLRDSFLRELSIDMTGVKELLLPQSLCRLVLRGTSDDKVSIDSSRCKDGVQLHINIRGWKPRHYGLACVDSLWVTEIDSANVGEIAERFPDLVQLNLTGRPGTVENLSAAGRLGKLRAFGLEDIFGFEERELEFLEQLPELRKLMLCSVPKSACGHLRKRWKDRLDELDIRRLRGDDWLRENLDNPLRHWDDSDIVPKAAYKKALALYKTACAQLKDCSAADNALEIVRQYIEGFNRLNEKYDTFIETAEREDIYASVEHIYSICPDLHGKVTLSELIEAMDRVRDGW